MRVHHINPHVINDDSNRDSDFSNLNGNHRSHFSVNGRPVGASQFRGILKLVIRILVSVLHLSKFLDDSQNYPQRHKNIFRKLADRFKK